MPNLLCTIDAVADVEEEEDVKDEATELIFALHKGEVDDGDGAGDGGGTVAVVVAV